MEEMKTEICILGAGLTGLTLAYYIKRYGKKVLLLEKKNRTGGVIQTIDEDGFLYETGPNTGTLATTELVALFDDLSEHIQLDTANPASKKRLILKNGKWHALPTGLKSAIQTKLFSFGDKLRILLEPFRRKGRNPSETLAELVKRRLGKTYLEYAVDPFISGIYGGDPNRLITRYALPKLYALEQEYGSFIKGAMRKRKLPKTEIEKRANREVFSVKGGLQKLVDALASEIGEEQILLNCRNTKVNYMKAHFEVQSYRADETISIKAHTVISTLGAHALESVFPFADELKLKSIRSLNYASIVQVIVGFKNWKGANLDAFGGLIPGNENKDVLGVLFPSSIFKGRAPEAGALLSFFLGGVKKPEIYEMSDAELEQIIVRELELLLDTTQKPDVLKIFRYKHAIPQYDANMENNLKAIQELQETHPGLILAGNISDGIGMADRVKQAKTIAKSLNNE
jgi:oxygen-dependent protoporphyrinogen oxidase